MRPRCTPTGNGAGAPLFPGLGLLRTRGLDAVAIEIATRHHVDLAQLLGRCRTKSVAAARAELYQRLRDHGLSLPEIGTLTDRDPTTVLAGLRRREQRGRLRFETEDAEDLA